MCLPNVGYTFSEAKPKKIIHIQFAKGCCYYRVSSPGLNEMKQKGENLITQIQLQLQYYTV